MKPIIKTKFAFSLNSGTNFYYIKYSCTFLWVFRYYRYFKELDDYNELDSIITSLPNAKVFISKINTKQDIKDYYNKLRKLQREKKLIIANNYIQKELV